ncbi:S41 family peptidase [Vampirovibrio chlorellavorus]|uniref:S41 family peptidase n=1 Tax=Vampirovibrio chlorellavorus TaxID=758823 RepID=UPI0026EBDDB3|nr:S41 family peptidase [Vampirovibrio chlorellavorus]
MSRRGIFTFLGLLWLSTILLSGCNGQSSNPASVFVSTLQSDQAQLADQLYEEAWRTVQEEYVDGTFNGQDWASWRYRYRGKLRDVQDAYVAIGTMVASLNDEYTRFLQPRDMSEQSMSIDSRLYGVGIQISKRDNKLLVLATIDDTPAQRAGLMPKDQITHINGKETAGMSVEDAADQIRGEKGTFVTLSIKRGKAELSKRIQRDEIKIKSVFTKPLNDPRIGYLRLSSFISETMLDEMKEALQQLSSKQALVLDLRGNYGGLFSNAVEAADMLMDQGKIVFIVNREHDRRSFEAHPGTINAKPLVVLIDGGSASASEILAGALKDNHRATLIGSQSFGKGLVQKVNPLMNNSGINITISKYLTPNGTDINKKGIEPDIKVPFTEADYLAQRDPQLDRAVQYLRGFLN